MRYDFTRCNNLRWRIGSNEGFIKTAEGRVCVLSDKLWLSDRGRLEHRQATEFGLDWAETWLDEHPDFEIIPRAPETYKDWQVGDVVTDKDGYYLDVAARLENIVFLSYREKDDCSAASDAYYTCEELYNHGYRLVLTDYEKERTGNKCELKDGDRVLLRATKSDIWTLGRFNSVEYNTSFPNMLCIAGRYMWCIPYNEKTWQLLDTADDYKEEEI